MTDAENDQQLAAVLAQPAKKAIAAIGAANFAAPDLERLAELEGEGEDRSTVKDAIAAAMEAQANAESNGAALEAGEGEGDTDASSEGGKEARGEEIPDWKKPDYTGSLTIDQALWRNKRFGAK